MKNINLDNSLLKLIAEANAQAKRNPPQLTFTDESFKNSFTSSNNTESSRDRDYDLYYKEIEKKLRENLPKNELGKKIRDIKTYFLKYGKRRGDGRILSSTERKEMLDRVLNDWLSECSGQDFGLLIQKLLELCNDNNIPYTKFKR